MSGALVNETTRTQEAAIRRHLMEYGWIDKPTAMELCDCDRLGARIYDIRHDKDDPLNIVTEQRTKKNRYGHAVNYAVYRLEEEKNG